MITLDYANKVATDISNRIVKILGSNVSSIYLFGSLALGDFSCEFSDIDLAII